MADRYVVGDTITISNTFKVAGALTDPTTVSLVVTAPDGTATTYTYAGSTITKSSTGLYTKNITASTAGLWSYTWTGTGTAADVESGSFNVEAVNPVAADTLNVLTLLEGKTAVGVTGSDVTVDANLLQKITAVSRRLDRACGPIVQRTVTDELIPGGRPNVWVRLWPVASFTTVTEYDSTTAQVLTLEQYSTQPSEAYAPERWTSSPTAVYNGRIHRRSSGYPACFPPGPEAVKVTYVAGRAATTAAVDPVFKDAAAVMLKNAWKPYEQGIQSVGEFDVPAQNFPRFGIPNYVVDMLRSEWCEVPGLA